MKYLLFNGKAPPMNKLLGVCIVGAALLTACSAPGSANTQAVTTGNGVTAVPPTQPLPPATMGPAANTFQIINAQQAKQMMDQSSAYVIVDVRTQSEYSGGHIAGAILIPVDQVSQLAPTMLPDKQQLIFVYCRSGARAAQASTTLAQMGYTNVFDFGGINSWPYGTVTG